MTKTNGFATQVEDVHTAPAEAPHGGEADLSDAELLTRLRSGDRKVLDALLRAARPRLAAVALKIVRNPDDAEDVVQDAFIKVWRYVGKFEGRSALSTWIHRIVVNTAVDQLRSRRQAPIAGGFATDDHDDERQRAVEGISTQTPEDLLGQAQIGAVVREKIERLPVIHRDVLALRELEEESYQSIADIVRCPIGTVMSRLHHARQRLAETMAAENADLIPLAA